METKTIKSTFTIFGNFSKINKRESELKKVFSDYQSRIGQETLPNGVAAKVYQFVNGNVGILIRAYRIDFEYGFQNESSTFEEMKNTFVDNSKKLLVLDSIKGTRIAYSDVQFVDNTNNVFSDKCNEAFNISNIFGSAAKELNVRVNHVKNILGEDFNSVLMMQDGTVSHNVTKEKLSAVFINHDINSIFDNQAVRFSLDNIEQYIDELVKEASERTETFVNKIVG